MTGDSLAETTAGHGPREGAGSDHLPPRGDTRRLGKDSLLVILVRIASMALNFALLFVMAHLMSLYQFGIASTALALLNVLVIPATMGCDTAAIRYVAVTRREAAALLGATRSLTRIVLATSSVTVLVSLGVAVSEGAAGRTAAAWAVAIIAPSVATFAFTRYREGWLRGSGSIVRAQVSSGLLIPGLSILLLLAASWSDLRLAAPLVLGLRAAAGLVAAGSSALFVHSRLRRLTSARDEPAAAPAGLRRVAVGLAALALLVMLSTQVDTLTVTYFLGPTQGGIYSAAARVALAMNIAIVSVNFGLAPRAARLAESRERLQRAAAAAATMSTVMMAAGCLVLIPFATLVMSAFGPRFTPGADALRILMVGQLVNGICGPVGTLMNMSGRQHYSMWTQALALGVQAVLLVTLTPTMGITGAAIATAVSNALWNILMAGFVRLRMGVWALPLGRQVT